MVILLGPITESFILILLRSPKPLYLLVICSFSVSDPIWTFSSFCQGYPFWIIQSELSPFRFVLTYIVVPKSVNSLYCNCFLAHPSSPGLWAPPGKGLFPPCVSSVAPWGTVSVPTRASLQSAENADFSQYLLRSTLYQELCWAVCIHDLL